MVAVTAILLPLSHAEAKGTTGYVPDGGIMEFGRGDMSRITRLCHAYDQLQVKMAKANSRHMYQNSPLCGRSAPTHGQGIVHNATRRPAACLRDATNGQARHTEVELQVSESHADFEPLPLPAIPASQGPGASLVQGIYCY